MADIVLACAAVLATIAAFMGLRTATLLVVALAINTLWLEAGLPMPWQGMVLADLVIIQLIAEHPPHISDKLIVLLFAVAWVGYALPYPLHRTLPQLAISAQLLLCLLPWLQRGIWKVSHGPLRELKYGAA